jgi:hypothetical protein
MDQEIHLIRKLSLFSMKYLGLPYGFVSCDRRIVEDKRGNTLRTHKSDHAPNDGNRSGGENQENQQGSPSDSLHRFERSLIMRKEMQELGILEVIQKSGLAG